MKEENALKRLNDATDMRLKIENFDKENHADREEMLLEAGKIVGQIEVANMFRSLGNVSNLIFLRRAKKLKLWRYTPWADSWESFCNHLGISRSKADKDLLILNTFGDEFTGNASRLGLGYRDLAKLRMLTQDGSFKVEDGVVVINGDSIPLSPDNDEHIKSEIDRLIEKKDQQITEQKNQIKRLERKVANVESAEIKTLRAHNDALLEQNQRLKQFEPGEWSDEWAAEPIGALHDHVAEFAGMVRTLLNDARIKDARNFDAREVAGRIEIKLRAMEDYIRDVAEAFNDVFSPDRNDCDL